MNRDELRKIIRDTCSDVGTDLLYYDRKEDEELEVGDIEQALNDGVLTTEELLGWICTSVLEHLGEGPPYGVQRR